MAHLIEKMDKQQGREMGWHGLTEVKPVLELDSCYLAEWDVKPVLMSAEGQETGFSIFKCTDNGALIGRPFSLYREENQGNELQTWGSYTPLYNKDFLALIKNSLAGTGHEIWSVGSVMNRGRIFVSVKLSGLEKYKAADRDFEPFLNFGSSHDMSCSFYCNTSNICTVCNNTFTLNLHHKGKKVNARIKHTKSMSDRIENLPQIIDAAVGVQAEFKAAMNSLAQAPLPVDTARALFAGFVLPESVTKPEDVSTRSENQINRLVQLFRGGAGNRGENRADAVSAITDYYTHDNSGGENKLRQFVSSEFGHGQNQKARFFNLIQDEEAVEKTVKRGLALVG